MTFSNEVMAVTMEVFDFLGVMFVFSLGCLLLIVIGMYIYDRYQSSHTIRRNYPVIGRFRYFFEHLGEFFRQYFFSMDREELPFNRADRSWVYRAAKNVERNIAFGSTRDLTSTGNVVFLNSAFPILETNANHRGVSWIGEGHCAEPFKVHSVFNISGMSYGALSKPAVKALAQGAKEAGVWMNTGEGGVSKYHLRSGCDLVVQIGTAKYGVRDDEGNLSTERLQRLAKLEQVKMFEIKLSQGAKPGKGGILPAEKVSAEIATIRGIPEGQASISPNAHPEIKSVSDLLDMIELVRNTTGKPVGCKFVLGASQWVEDLCKEILIRGEHCAPDFITLDSADGGSGAAPQTLMDYVGLPIQESLPIVVDKLSEYGFKKRIKVIASGKLLTPSSVAWALCMGADYVVSARGFMFSLGCIQALQCNKNTCPTGITTHDKDLQRGLDWRVKSKRVVNYVNNMHKELEYLAHSCGIQTPREFRREHANIIIDAISSKNMAELYPYKETKEELVRIID